LPLDTDTVYVLQSAYVSLVNQNKQKKVTVTDVVQKAKVSRGTFYIYYDSIEYLKKDIERRLFDDMRQCSQHTESGREALRNQLDKVGNYTLLNRDLFYIFLVYDKDTEFIEKYKRFIKNNIITFCKGCKELNPVAMEYIAIAILSIVTYWVGFDSITINDITTKATINRATFYAHFPDKYALLDTIISENFIEILRQKISPDSVMSNSLLASLVESVCEYFEVAEKTCKGYECVLDLMSKEIVFQLTEIIFTLLDKKAPDTNEGKILAKLTASMVSTSIYIAVHQWEKSGRPISRKLLIDLIIKFESSGISQFF